MIALWIFITALTVSLSLLCVHWRKIKGWPPSPPGFPIIGHLHLLGKLPHQSLLQLAAKHGGLMYLKLGSIDTLVVSSAEAAREFFSVHDRVFASRPDTRSSESFGFNGAGLLWAKYGDYWRNMRKICSLELLTSKRVELSKPVRRLEISGLIKELLDMSKKKLPVNLTTKLSDVTFNIIMRVTTSRTGSGSCDPQEAAETKHLKELIVEAFTVSGTSVSEFFPFLKVIDPQIARMKAIKQFFDSYMVKEIIKHRERLTTDRKGLLDFMDVMVSLGDSVSLDSIKSLTLDMISGGMDTTAVTVEWALAELIRKPELMQRAQAELTNVVGEERTLEENDVVHLSYLKAVVKETLRLHPPGPLMAPHESTEPCTLGGFVIPAGTRAIVNIYAIARDPSFWTEPLVFNPDRFLGSGNSIDVKGQCYNYMPFGSGRRSCPAILLGMTTVQLLLGTLLHAFDWSLPDGEPGSSLDMSESFGLTVPRACHLKLVPAARLVPQAYSSL